MSGERRDGVKFYDGSFGNIPRDPSAKPPRLVVRLMARIFPSLWVRFAIWRAMRGARMKNDRRHRRGDGG